MKKVSLILTNLFILGIVCTGLYLLIKNSKQEDKIRLENINQEFLYSRGVITNIKYYKGHSLTVRYIVNGKIYTYNGGWDFNPKRLSEGDSISIRFSTNSPQYLITELEKEY